MTIKTIKVIRIEKSLNFKGSEFSGSEVSVFLTPNVKMAQMWTPQTDKSLSRFLPTENRAQATQQPDKDKSPSLTQLLF